MEDTNINFTTEAEETLDQHINLYQIIPVSTILVAIITVGVVGNFSVLWVICTYSELRKSVMNIYIFNMALADLVMNLTNIPDAVQFMMNRGWIFGEASCKILRYCMVNSLYVSILSLLAVTVERYVAIIHPMQAHALLTKRRITIATCIIWVISVACALPTAIFLTVRQMSDSKSYCILALSDSREKHLKLVPIYKYLEFGLYFAAPLITQVILYFLISKRLRASTNKLRISLDHTKQQIRRSNEEASLIKNCTNKSQYSTTEIDPENQVGQIGQEGDTTPYNNPKKRQSMPDWRSSNTIKSRQHVIRMLTACVVVYFISYTPAQILLFYDTFSKQKFHQTWLFRAAMLSLVFINAAANPIIYCICSQTYRSRFRVMYCCDKEKSRRARRLKALDSTIRSGGGSMRTVTTSRGDGTHDIRLFKHNGTEAEESEYYNSQLENSLLTGSSKPTKV